MLERLSGKTHQVYTGICLKSIQNNIQHTFAEITLVTFRTLAKEDILHYIATCQPFDKAGAYGIQEWIGAIGITSIEGSYNNVVGLPTHLLYKTLNAIAEGS